MVAHDDVVAIRDDLNRARRFVFKSHSAGRKYLQPAEEPRPSMEYHSRAEAT
jgi:hypothetical protein